MNVAFASAAFCFTEQTERRERDGRTILYLRSVGKNEMTFKLADKCETLEEFREALARIIANK
jgi:hypothetical protein